ncbi:MAG TPA: dockerin type I repeat-containing protein, partial [Gemmatimonadaceae bacterium]|nr:dockerin type I repeat-containing protein [Gemmatimonadaceae bacterium]
IAPTIAVDRDSIAQGEPVTIFGQTAPGSDVSITVHSAQQLDYSTKADGAGIYSYTFLTGLLEQGKHQAQARSLIAGAASGVSSAAYFRIGAAEDIPGSGDLNGDGRVNIVDFSIAAFWFKKPSPPTNVDLNGDGRVDIVDFSVLAYNWTG